MKPLRRSLMAFFLLAAGGDVLANEVRDYRLEKKIQLSDVVVIGHVISKSQESVGDLEYSRVQVNKTLKGKPPDRIDVLSKGSIAEMNPDCCEAGKAYLLTVSNQSTEDSAYTPYLEFGGDPYGG